MAYRIPDKIKARDGDAGGNMGERSEFAGEVIREVAMPPSDIRSHPAYAKKFTAQTMSLPGTLVDSLDNARAARLFPNNSIVSASTTYPRDIRLTNRGESLRRKEPTKGDPPQQDSWRSRCSKCRTFSGRMPGMDSPGSSTLNLGRVDLLMLRLGLNALIYSSRPDPLDER
jgi:hypothetical protein